MLLVLPILGVLGDLEIKACRQDIFAQDTLQRVKVQNDTLSIDTIAIRKELLSPDSIYRKKQKEHRTIYLWGDNKKPIQINPFGGIIINKVYSHFSKKGKESRRLQRVFNVEYNADLINAIWRPYTVEFTELKGDSLFVFQTYFLPEYRWFSKATHYEKVEYVIRSMRTYRDSSAFIHRSLQLPKVYFK